MTQYGSGVAVAPDFPSQCLCSVLPVLTTATSTAAAAAAVEEHAILPFTCVIPGTVQIANAGGENEKSSVHSHCVSACACAYASVGEV